MHFNMQGEKKNENKILTGYSENNKMFKGNT